MGKILIVEPYRILQQAISLALVSEHEIESRQTLEAAERGKLEEYDLVVIDAQALKEKNALTDDLTLALQECRTPLLWLQTEEIPQLARQDGFKSLKTPLDRGSLLAAVGELLSGKASPKGPGTSEKGADQAGSEPIDLVEVVDEK